MDKAERGIRRKGEERLYRSPSHDDSIEPDRVSPAIEGYFRLPAIWVGTKPEDSSVRVLNPDIHHQRIIKKNLRCGVNVEVYRDGRFMFEFSHWPLAPIVTIPGYSKPDPPYPHRPPIEHGQKGNEAENHAITRAQAMNVHQACLATAETVVKNRSAMMGFPVTAWNTLKAVGFNVPVSYADDSEDMHALARNVLNNSYKIPREKPIPRRVIEKEVVEYSLELFDNILIQNDLPLIQIVEAGFLSACRIRDKRYGEALTLAWAACEQLISIAWKEMIESSESEGTKLPRNRKKKLTGRDFTASVMIEMLELNRRIDPALYELLENTRKARNKWAHEMESPNSIVANSSIKTFEELLGKIKGVKIKLQTGGRGGVPQWPIWIYEGIRKK